MVSATSLVRHAEERGRLPFPLNCLNVRLNDWRDFERSHCEAARLVRAPNFKFNAR